MLPTTRCVRLDGTFNVRRNYSDDPAIGFNDLTATARPIMSVSTLAGAPSRDYLGEWYTLLDTAGGRDKLARLLQYTAKFMKWREDTKPEKERNQQLSAAYNNLYNGMAMVSNADYQKRAPTNSANQRTDWLTGLCDCLRLTR